MNQAITEEMKQARKQIGIQHRMSDETAMSIESVRKALLEKEREKLLSESGPAGLSDGEKLMLSKTGLGKDEFSECRYFGHGVFDETLF